MTLLLYSRTGLFHITVHTFWVWTVKQSIPEPKGEKSVIITLQYNIKLLGNLYKMLKVYWSSYFQLVEHGPSPAMTLYNSKTNDGAPWNDVSADRPDKTYVALWYMTDVLTLSISCGKTLKTWYT